MKDINLLQGFKPKRKEFDLKRNARLSGFMLIGVVVFLSVVFFGMKLMEIHYINKTAELQTEALSYKAVSETKNAVIKKDKEIKNITELLSAASSTSHVDTNFLWTISSTLNENVFFENLIISEDGNVGISGKSATRKDITYFVYTLKKTGLFSDIAVNLIDTETQKEGAGADIYDFTVSAVIGGGLANE